MANLLHHVGQWIAHDEVPQPRARDVLDRIEDRRPIEDGLESHIPDRPHVAKAHVERGEQHRQPGGEHAQEEHEREQLEPRPAHRDAPGEHEDHDRDEVEQEVEVRGEYPGHGDDQAREVDLPHYVLAVHHRAHGRARGLGEECECDDSLKQHHGVLMHTVAESHGLGEHDQHHPEQE
jgi:hypothetical protein